MQQGFTELSDSQWQILEKILGETRKRKHSLRVIFNAILWINRTGAQWRMLDSKYPPWSTVYYYFKKWESEGFWEFALDVLTEGRRKTLNIGLTQKLRYDYLTELSYIHQGVDV
jgi:transposase